MSSNYNRSNDLAVCMAVCVWQQTPRTADVTKIDGILMNRWFFSYIWHSYFLRYGRFVEYVNMHAMNMQLTVGLWGGLDLHPWRHNNVGVSLRVRRDATQVMLGCHGGPGGTQL